MAGKPKTAARRKAGDPLYRTTRSERRKANKARHAAALAEHVARELQRPRGEHRMYTDQDLVDVLDAISSGDTLRGKCRELGIKESSVRMKLMSTPELERMFMAARRSQAHAMAEDNLEDLHAADTIDTREDGAHVELAIIKHKFDVRRYTMAKYHVGAYGDKVEVTVEGGRNPIRTLPAGTSPADAMSSYMEEVRKLPPP